MQLKDKINAFVSLGNFLREIAETNDCKKTREVFQKAEAENGWFTRETIKSMCKSWANTLTEKNLRQWVSKYNLVETTPKTIGIVMAGNVPLVGFHDFLSVLITGNSVSAKLSSNDKTLLPFLAEYLISIAPAFNDKIAFTSEKLENFDAVIATGSNNTARYFEYYFGKYPNIIRKNRNGVGVLTGNESEKDLKLLADDIFQYFGLGCRNVSKLYVPKDYNFEPFFRAMYAWKDIIHHSKYINNYDYNKAVYLMGGFPLLDNEFLLLKEDTGLSSPISVVFYEKYDSIQNLEKELTHQAENIQCLVSKSGLPNEIPFGKSQNPELWDYADNIDTVSFLLKLS